MLLALLPALTLAATEPIAFDSLEELERAVSVGVRSAIEAGWTLADVSPEDDGSGFGFTLTKDGEVERHVAVFDGNVYRVGPGKLPEEPTRPSEQLMAALRAGGGVEITSSCEGWYEQPYFIDGFAAGADARALVARSLAAADDLEGASMSRGRAVFQLESGGHALDLIVTLADDGGVAEAELRRYASRPDLSAYRRRGAMARALRHAFVSSIHEDDHGLVLRTSRGRFAIDPDGKAFRAKPFEELHEGCGC